MRRALLAALTLLAGCATSGPPRRDLAEQAALWRAPPPSSGAPERTRRERSILTRKAIGTLALGGLRLADSRWKPGEVQGLTNVNLTVKSNKAGSLPWLGLNFGLQGSRDTSFLRNRNNTIVDSWQIDLSAGPRVFVPIPAIPAFVYAGVAGGMGYGERQEDLNRQVSEFFFAWTATAGVTLHRGDAGIGLEGRRLYSEEFGSTGLNVPNDSDSHQIALTFSSIF